MIAAIDKFFSIERERNPQFTIVERKVEVRRHHADDCETLPIEPESLIDDVRISAKPTLPDGVLQDHHLFASQLVFIRGEGPAVHRFRAKRVEEIRRYAVTEELLGLISFRQI